MLVADLTSVAETRKLAEEANAIGTDKLEDGVETYTMLAEGDYDQNLTGVYFEPKKKIGELLAVTADKYLQEVVVKACEDVTGLKLVA